MSVAKIVEISGQSPESFEAAVREGIEKATDSVRNIKEAWVKELKVVVKDGKVDSYRADMKVTFIVE